MLFLYIALVALPLADAVSITFLAPAMTAALAALLLREPAGWRTAVGCLVSVAGVLVISEPPMLVGLLAGHAQPWGRRKLLGVGAGLACALLTALAYVCIRHISKCGLFLVVVVGGGGPADGAPAGDACAHTA